MNEHERGLVFPIVDQEAPMGDQQSGRTAVVTGASSGIGRAIAERLGGEGATVFLAGRTVEAMEVSADAIRAAGGKADVTVIDVRDRAALEGLVERAGSETGRLDVMVNNAGLGNQEAIVGGDPEWWREMLEVNVLALLIGCNKAVDVMRSTGSGGNIINISSIGALRPDSGVYGATKAAVNLLTASLRQELEQDDIRVTSLMPGVIATSFARNMDPSVVAGIGALAGVELDVQPGQRLPDDALAGAQAALEAHIAKPEDIADAVAYVLSLPRRLNIPELIVRPAASLAF
jgi:NADP-dependent 3-hydroxy acid dehydrogenase YdfG